MPTELSRPIRDTYYSKLINEKLVILVYEKTLGLSRKSQYFVNMLSLLHVCSMFRYHLPISGEISFALSPNYRCCALDLTH
jgi:hypothetical protein